MPTVISPPRVGYSALVMGSLYDRSQFKKDINPSKRIDESAVQSFSTGQFVQDPAFCYQMLLTIQDMIHGIHSIHLYTTKQLVFLNR